MTDHRTNTKSRKWTVMIYLAGDNNLESYALKDLSEMSRIGSSSDVAIIAQLDQMSDQSTRRYFLTSQMLEENCVSECDEVNTGDPQALLDFVLWTTQTYPAERYALILWNHGSGWKDEDIYSMAQRQEIAAKVTRGQIRSVTSGRARHALFKSSLDSLLMELVQTQRAILFDDSSADFLDNMELRCVLQKVTEQMGHPIDLIGFDACLMNMLEVHYQIQEFCGVAVGSQELEPGDGWPYDLILEMLVRNPDMTPEELAQSIVGAYVDFYRTHFPNLSITQSAVRLKDVHEAIRALDSLAKCLKDSLSNHATVGAIFTALRSAQRFSDRDYVDLIHFCRLLTDHDPAGEIGKAAQLVTDALRGKTTPIIAEGHHGPKVANSHGISIYFPSRDLSPLYQRLEFAQKHAWHDFLAAFIFPS